MRKALMIIAMIAIVAIAGSTIYYFVFFKPEIAKAEIRLQEQKLEIETKNNERKATEEALRKANLEKCLKDAEDWKARALKALLSMKDLSNSSYETLMKFIQDEYQNKIDNCNSNYGK